MAFDCLRQVVNPTKLQNQQLFGKKVHSKNPMTPVILSTQLFDTYDVHMTAGVHLRIGGTLLRWSLVCPSTSRIC